jgi:pyruvate kinase
MVLRLAEAGADVFRLNFSHGTRSDHLNNAVFVRAAEQTVGRPLGLLADLQGPNLRIGRFEAGRVSLRPGQRFRLDLDPAAGDSSRVCLPHSEIFAALRPGDHLLLDDGRVSLRAIAVEEFCIEAEVCSGTQLSDRKGVNLPGSIIPIPH